MLKSNQRWKLENINPEKKNIVREFNLISEDGHSWITDDKSGKVGTSVWNQPERFRMTLICEDITKEDHSIKFFKKAIEQTIQWADCTCSEDHQHNDRGCITGMCSCRSKQSYKIIPVEKKSHRFDKYARTFLKINKKDYLSTACIDCGLAEGTSVIICTPDPNWRILQEKQFAFYMEESDKIKKMNGSSI